MAIISGIALALSDWPACWTYLHFVALVPLFVGYMACAGSPKVDWLTGLIFVSTYGGLMAYSAATVLPVWIVVIWSVIQWTFSLSVVGRMLHRHWFIGPLAAAATVTLVELFVWHAIPIFGMAQCFARVTSAVPSAIQFAAYTGLAGVAFALVFSQGLLAGIISGLVKPDRDQLKRVSVLLGFLLVLSAVNYARWHRPLGKEAPAAVFGWAGQHQLSLAMMCEAAREKRAHRSWSRPSSGSE